MAHTYDNKTNSARSNGSPKTFTHTCGVGSTLLVLTLVIDGATTRSGGAPTYNSVAFTQADTARAATETNVELWYLLTPQTGSAYTVSIPNSGAVYITAETSSYKAEPGNTTVLREASYTTGISTNPTGPTHTTTVYGDVIVGVMGYGDDSSSSGASGTSLHHTDEGTYASADQYALDGRQYLMWTDSTVEDWVIISAVFKEMPSLVADSVGVSKGNTYAVLTPSGDVFVSKANTYAVLQDTTAQYKDSNISKAVVYSVLAPLSGSNISKAVVYSVLAPLSGSNISKAVVYTVLAPPITVTKPFTFIF